MRRLLPFTRAASLGIALLVTRGAAAQHDHATPSPADGPMAVAETFVVTGLRVDEADPPPGSGVGRAGLRFADGGYVSVVHGKPYARGRVLWGGLVAWGTVWSAGAHRATELVTTVPLVIGGTRVEPGAASLFVTPRADAPWTLHVNRHLGAHLTDEYDLAADLATVDAVPTALVEPVEGLTWAFAADGTALVLSWGDTSVTFPIARADA